MFCVLLCCVCGVLNILCVVVLCCVSCCMFGVLIQRFIGTLEVQDFVESRPAASHPFYESLIGV